MPVVLFSDAVFLVGVFLTFTKHKDKTNLFYIVPSQVLMTFLIFQSGGVHAPGIFWLSAIPVIWALLYQVKGLVFGFVTVVFSYLFMWFNYLHLDVFAVFPSVTAINRAKLENFFLFTTFISAFILAYTIVLRRSQEKIEEKQHDIESLLRILVHDVSNPLMVIKSCLHILNEQPSSNIQALTTMMVRSSDRMHEIVTDVRQLYSLQDGKQIVDVVNSDLMSCIHDSIETLKSRLESKNIKIVIDKDDDHFYALINPSLITNQVITNILSNAIKFSSNSTQIWISVIDDAHSIRVEVRDEGIGIPSDLLDSVFETTSPTSRMGTEGEKGTGYGLPIVNQIMNKHRGAVRVFSPPPGYSSGTLVQLEFHKDVRQESFQRNVS